MTQRPLRVMTFLHSFSAGGVERIALRLCRVWQQDPALDVALIIGHDAGPLHDEFSPGLRYQAITSGHQPAPQFGTVKMIMALRRKIIATRPDVIFCAGNTYSFIAVVLKLVLGDRCPPIILKISNDLERPDMPWPIRQLYWLFLRLQGRLLQAYIGLAKPMQAELAHRLAVPNSQITIIEDPALSVADLYALQALGASRTPPPAGRRYLAIGRLERQKNFALLIVAFARIARPDDRLTILGDGSERQRLEAQVAAAGLEGQIALPGYGPVPPALAAADVLVLSSLFEAVPAVVIEALATGLPVVSTHCSISMPSLIGLFGTIVPLGDSAALSRAMQHQPALCADQRKAAAKAMQAFTLEQASASYSRVFQSYSPENAILPH